MMISKKKDSRGQGVKDSSVGPRIQVLRMSTRTLEPSNPGTLLTNYIGEEPNSIMTAVNSTDESFKLKECIICQ